MSIAVRASLVVLLLLPLSGCRRAVPSRDAGPDDVPDGGAVRESASLYRECSLAEGCSGVDELCFPIRANGRETAWCSYLCDDEDDCPSGMCVIDHGTVDDRPRCHETCVDDDDCNDPTFGCFRVGVMSTRGSYEADVCYPR